MKRTVSIEDNPVITAGFAHYCGPWEWEKYTQSLFAAEGYEMLIPDIPIDDKDATYDDFAAIIRAAQKEKGAKEYIELSHSWSGDLSYRQLGSVPISMSIFLGTPLRPVLETAGVPKDEDSRGILYHALVKAEENGLTEFDPEGIGDALFRGIGDTAVKAWATSQLRPHPHTPKDHDRQDENAYIPDGLVTHYVGFKNDYIFKFRSQERTAKSLGIDFTPIPTGHFPMLENPELLVKVVAKIIEDKREDRQRRLNESYYEALKT
jgi:hypothetical protein